MKTYSPLLCKLDIVSKDKCRRFLFNKYLNFSKEFIYIIDTSFFIKYEIVNIEYLYQHAKLFYAYEDKKVEAY